jgi:hypothetical protein
LKKDLFVKKKDLGYFSNEFFYAGAFGKFRYNFEEKVFEN